MSEAPFVESRVVGFFEPTFVASGRVPVRVEAGAAGMLSVEATPPTRFHDARHLQAEARKSASTSEAAFFEEHGFVLLQHASAVADWDVDTTKPENELSRTYLPEVEALISRHLLPGRRVDIWQSPPMRRGPGTPSPEYAAGVHQDFGRTPDDYQESIEVFASPEIAQLWRDRYEQDDVAGFLAINFWRTAGMEGPLRHMPLGFCHPASVRAEDVVSIGLLDFAPSGKPTNQLALRYAEGQRWYYYPEMTPDEVLVFKQFEFFKDDPERPMASCFHSAFELPDTPADAEERQSSEHRVLIFCLRG